MSGVGMQVEILDVGFAARVTGVGLAQLDDHEVEELRAMWLAHPLLVFPGQYLTGAEQNDFARHFGELEFESAPLSNVKADGSLRADDDSDDMVKVLRGNMDWHHDSTYMAVQAKGAVFTAQAVPAIGGETGFADMTAAYEALDEVTRRRIGHLSAHHSLYHSQPDVGDEIDDGDEDSEYSGYGFFGQDAPLRPLVKVHPDTGRRSLLVGRHAYGIPGLTADESGRLLDDLVTHACQPPRVHEHHWSAGDAVLWDNRCLMHRARPWDMSEPRVMYHTRIAGDPVTEYAPPG